MAERGTKVVVVALGYAGLSVASRRWHRSWGTAAQEAIASLPGDELISDAALRTTRGIEIHAPPEKIWPCLIQMGQGRGGLHTYEWIENPLGAKIHNLDRIDPQLQQLNVIRLTPEAYLGRIPGSTTGSQRSVPNGRSSWCRSCPPAD